MTSLSLSRGQTDVSSIAMYTKVRLPMPTTVKTVLS